MLHLEKVYFHSCFIVNAQIKEAKVLHRGKQKKKNYVKLGNFSKKCYSNFDFFFRKALDMSCKRKYFQVEMA